MALSYGNKSKREIKRGRRKEYREARKRWRKSGKKYIKEGDKPYRSPHKELWMRYQLTNPYSGPST